MLADPLFNAIWNVIKNWDISVPHIYVGYCGATGNHARVIYDAIKAQLDALKRDVRSDGYHTFDELYEHRHTLFIALCRELAASRPINPVWRSRLHADGTMFPDWFIMGVHDEQGRQITYHLPASLWADTNCAETLDRAPEFDGHTSTDVLQRLARLSGIPFSSA
jgi:hypothetical protein